jgi:hypothetical protein
MLYLMCQLITVILLTVILPVLQNSQGGHSRTSGISVGRTEQELADEVRRRRVTSGLPEDQFTMSRLSMNNYTHTFTNTLYLINWGRYTKSEGMIITCI